MKIGDFTKNPCQAGGLRTDLQPQSTAEPKLNKPKSEVIKDLGLSPSQVKRIETLADNKGLIEQEKAVARKEGRMPTRTNVLDLAQERKKREQAKYVQIDADYKNLGIFRKAMQSPDLYTLTEEILDSVAKVDDDLPNTISDLAQYIEHLTIVKNKLILKGAAYGKTKCSQ